MKPPLDFSHIEVVSERVASVLRLMTPAERVAIALAMTESTREHIGEFVRREHPDWDDGLVRAEVRRRMQELDR